jgi:hypothetical protein
MLEAPMAIRRSAMRPSSVEVRTGLVAVTRVGSPWALGSSSIASTVIKPADETIPIGCGSTSTRRAAPVTSARSAICPTPETKTTCPSLGSSARSATVWDPSIAFGWAVSEIEIESATGSTRSSSVPSTVASPSGMGTLARRAPGTECKSSREIATGRAAPSTTRASSMSRLTAPSRLRTVRRAAPG